MAGKKMLTKKELEQIELTCSEAYYDAANSKRWIYNFHFKFNEVTTSFPVSVEGKSDMPKDDRDKMANAYLVGILECFLAKAKANIN